MATSWQYNTSANMGSYGSVTVVPHTPITPLSGTSNSQYGAWFGTAPPGSRPITGGGGGLQNRSSMRVLGTVPSANDKYSSMKTNTVSAMMGHPVPDPKEKFSSLANKFGAGRILTPITSQYDQIMQEEEEAKPSWKDSKTPIHSPDVGDSINHVMSVDIKKISENGHKRMTFKDDGLPLPQKDSYESSLESRSSNLTPKLPTFERSQTLLSMAQQTPNLGTELAAKSPFSLGQRSNTFTTSDTTLNRYGTRDIAQKPLYPWRHEPHPPSQPPPTPTNPPTSSASLSGSTLNGTIPRSSSDHVDSAGSQRTTISSDPGISLYSDSSQTHSSLSSHSSQSSTGANSMYWLYGSRGRPPPTPFRPNSYMYKMDQQGDTLNRAGVFITTADRDGAQPLSDLSPVASPRGYSLHTTSANDLLHSSPREDPLSSITPETKYNPSTSSVVGRSAKKSILKKTSSYDTGFDFPYFSDPSLQFRMDNSRSLTSVTRAPPGSPVKLSSGSGKRVTFKLTPRTREISPREGHSRDYMNMFSGFRFDSSLTGSSEI